MRDIQEILRQRSYKEFDSDVVGFVSDHLDDLTELKEFQSHWHGVWYVLNQLSEEEMADIYLDINNQEKIHEW